MIKKKRYNSYGEYIQTIPSHYGYIYIIEDLKEFKKLCKQIQTELKEKNIRSHASFGDQDFRYLSSLYKILYKKDLPIISELDK